jgi:hypothetical protein
MRVSVLSLLIAGGILSAATAPQSFHRPLTFEPNFGQAPAQFQWMGQSSGYQVMLGPESLTIVIPDKRGLPAPSMPPQHALRLPYLNYSAVRMKLAGSRPWKKIAGADVTATVSNYFNQGNPERSINRVPQYKQVKVANVYEGIDLILYANGGDLEYDFAVAPGADPRQIQMDFEGAGGMRVDPQSGDLILTLADGSALRLLKPTVYQQVGDRRVAIAGAYQLSDGKRAAFTLAGYDRSRGLVIDPRLTISRSFDGLKDDEANGIAVDADGNSYLTGYTFSHNFPVTDNSVFSLPKNCGIDFCGGLAPNPFIAKITSDGSLAFVTYDGVGFGSGIAVDSSGIYITGQAVRPDTDINPFPFDNNFGDMFVQRLSLTGQGIYFAVAGGPGEGFGSGQDFGNAIALDDLHNAWAVGASYPGAGIIPPGDAVIFKVAPDGTRLVQRFYSSTDGDDIAMGVAVANRQPWVTGTTCGTNFVTTNGTTHPPGHCAVFVLHLDEAGNRLMGTIFGGDGGDDGGVGIAMNGSNSVYVTGYTNSLRFPRTTDGELPPQGTFGFQFPAGFVMEVESFGKLVRSVLLRGPDGFVRPYAIANDDRGRGLYVAGTTSSRSFPGADERLDPNASLFGFVTKLSPDLIGLRYTVILGQQLSAIVLRGPSPVFPEIYVAGWENGFSREAFMVKMLDENPASRMRASTLPQVFQKSFTVAWTGSSPLLNAVSFDIFVSDNGGPFTVFQAATTATSASFTGVSGHTYGFFSIASEGGGLREPMKTKPEITVKVTDNTPPVISPQLSGTPGNNGWYRSAVTANWSVSDPESDIASSTGCATTKLTADTAGVTLTCSASNAVGLSTSVPTIIKIDQTAPVISGMPAAGCSLWPPNHKLVQVAKVTATDLLSGLAAGSFLVTGASSEPSANPNDPEIVIAPDGSGGFTVQLQADRLGSGNGRTYTLTATAMDNAGNSVTATSTCVVPHDKGSK